MKQISTKTLKNVKLTMSPTLSYLRSVNLVSHLLKTSLTGTVVELLLSGYISP